MSSTPANNNSPQVRKELEKLSSPSSLSYVLEQRSGAPLLKLSVSYNTLLQWRGIKKRLPNVSFLQLYRLTAHDLPFEIKADAPRLEERFRVLSSIVDKQCKGSLGNTRVKLLQKVKVIEVYDEELINVSNLRKRVVEAEQENLNLKEKLQEVDERCEELLVELMVEKQKLQQECESHNIEMEALASENIELKRYIDNLESLQESHACNNCNEELKNSGKNISEVGGRQKIRKMKLLSTRAERALWFVESFGLKLHSLSLVDKEGQTKQIPFGRCENNKSIFSDLCEEEKDKIRGVLFIMDRFSVSDAAYHEFSMMTDGMERSYLVRQCRTDLNKLIHITKTPGKQPGVQMSFKEELHFQLKQVSPKLGNTAV